MEAYLHEKNKFYKCVRKYEVLIKKENRFVLIRWMLQKKDIVILIINTPNNKDLMKTEK